MPSSLADAVAGFDTMVDRWFDRIRGRRWADALFYGASALGDHGIIWLLMAALRARRSEEDRRAAVRAAIGVGVESVVVNLGVKSLFMRVRPVTDHAHPFNLRKPRTSSFPSGHASAAFTAASLLGEDDPWRPVYYGVAVIVAASRIYVKIHHASDVVAGVALGAVLGRAGRRLAPLAKSGGGRGREIGAPGGPTAGHGRHDRESTGGGGRS